MHNTIDKNSEMKILRMADVVTKTGFSKSWIYELIRQGDFPAPKKIGSRTIGFNSADVGAWIIERLRG